MKRKLISICITSFNRPKELRRCLESIKTKYEEQIEIVISEDLSPKREEIRQEIEEFKCKTRMLVHSNYNFKNLGYDRNLETLISLAQGDYILFVSDDDAIIEDGLNDVIETLSKHPEIPCLFSAYKSSDKKAQNREYNHSFMINCGKKSVSKYLYESILFSGLIFKKQYVDKISAERFVNLNYFQVYLFMKTIYEYGGYYRNCYLIECIGDGENGYGTTELSEKDPLLADRSSVYSDIRFNEGLVKIIKIFDSDENENIINMFSKEYSLRTYRGMSMARSLGKKELKKYWSMINNIGIKIKMPAPIYYVTLMILGSEKCDRMYEIPRKVLFSLRYN